MIISALVQTGLLIVAVILPMIYFDVLPAATLTSFLVAPPPPPPPPPPPAATPIVRAVKVIPRQFDAGKLMTPKSVPKDIAVIREDELPPSSAGVGVVGGVPGGMAGGTVGGVLGSILTQLAPGRRLDRSRLLKIVAHHAGERGVPFGRDLADFPDQIVLKREGDVHIPIIRETRIQGKGWVVSERST